MDTGKFINDLKYKTNQLKNDIKTKWILAIIGGIDPRLYEILTYKEKREASLSPWEYSKRGRLAGYAHDKLTTLKETVYEYANRKEQEIKENIEWQVKEVIKHIDNLPQDLIDHIEEALAYKILDAEDDMVERKYFKAGDSVQKLVLDLGKLDARISWYIEVLNKLGLNLDEDDYIGDLLIITKANDRIESNKSFEEGREKDGKWKKIESKENTKLEIWFQREITTILHANKQQKIWQIITSLQKNR